MILPQDPVQASIVQALNNHCHDDAIFLSERLFAEAPTNSTLFLLATCYYQAGGKSQAYRFLKSKGYPTPRCRYLYSKCCFEIGKLDEAEFVLTNGNKSLKSVKEFSEEYEDNAPFAISLLADVYRKTERHDKALECYQTSLSLNPFMWSSFCNICKLGGRPDPEKMFQASRVQQVMSSVKSVLFSPHVSLGTALTGSRIDTTSSSTPHDTEKHSLVSTPGDQLPVMADIDNSDVMDTGSLRTPANETGTERLAPPPIGKLFLSNIYKTPSTSSFGTLPLDTPLPGLYDLGTPTMATPLIGGMHDMPPAPTKRSQSLLQPPASNTTISKLVFGQSSTSNTKSDAMVAPPRPTYQGANTPTRRSKRLEGQGSSNVKENSKVLSRTKHTSPRSSVRRARSNQSHKMTDEISAKNRYNSSVRKPSSAVASATGALDLKQKHSASAFLSLLRDLGAAYLASQTFDVKRAVEIFENIPYQQYKTGWVLAEVGKAYLELSEYQKAEEAFRELRMLEPHQVQGMETYSTVLFHLQKDVALSTLAQDMVQIDKSCPQTWCVNGNCFSLQKEHETAIRFLQRAIQVDPSFAYAYTLLGHEYTLTEDYDKAMSAFRNALRVDARHYNAWYGLGMIFYKKEKFALAEAHFKKALAINPQSAVLLCHIGLVQHALQRHSLALETLNQAVELSPRNPMCLFHRASMLVANDRLEQALEELESLKVLTPKESLVYFLIGKVHKKLGNAHLSMLNFSWATDLDPKGANNHIKDAIDRRYVTDEDEDLSLDTSVLLRDTPSETLSTDTSVMDSDEAHQQLQANESDDSII